MDREPRAGLDPTTSLIAKATLLGVFWWGSAVFASEWGEIAHPRIWLAIGVYLGVVLITPARSWWVLALAVLGADLALRRSGFRSMHLIGWISDSAAVMATAWLAQWLQRRTPDSLFLAGPHALQRLLLLGTMPGVIGAELFLLGNQAFGQDAGSAWMVRFSSRSLGVLVTTPVVLCLYQLTRSPDSRRKYTALAKDAGLIVGAAFLTYGSMNWPLLPTALHSPLLVYPFLLWIALFGRVGLTATACLTISLVMMAGAMYGSDQGAARQLSVEDSIVRLQMIIAVTCFSHLVLSIVVGERKRAADLILSQQRQLERTNEALADENRRRQAAEQAAAAANQNKRRFLADMSHEIRSPLSTMLGFVDLLGDSPTLSGDDQNSLRLIRRNGDHLRTLVDAILDLSKVEAGQLTVNPAPFCVAELMTEITETMRPRARAKGLDVTGTVATGMPEHLISDVHRLKQILINAVGNAIKFTDAGLVTVTMSCRNLDGSKLQLVCLVEDTGIGISHAERQRLFQPFAQANDAITARYGGTGLGLTLSRRLAQLLGGDFALDRSEVGVGSVFRLTIASEPAPAKPRPLPSAARSGGHGVKPRGALSFRRLLVADDADDSRLLTTRILQLSGAEVDSVDGGKLAVERALATDYDAVLLDLQMLDLDGLQVMTILRAQGRRCPVIAVTGRAMAEEVTACLAAGFDAHLAKPIDRQSMVATLERLIKRYRSEASPELFAEALQPDANPGPPI